VRGCLLAGGWSFQPHSLIHQVKCCHNSAHSVTLKTHRSSSQVSPLHEEGRRRPPLVTNATNGKRLMLGASPPDRCNEWRCCCHFGARIGQAFTCCNCNLRIQHRVVKSTRQASSQDCIWAHHSIFSLLSLLFNPSIFMGSTHILLVHENSFSRT
jgi:hypothetical protein